MTAQTNYFLDQLLRTSETTLFSLADVLLAMTVSTLLCFVLAQVYRHTHRGTSYSQSFLVTMFVMGVATSIVMLIIGSTIARAFSLVGALSIIRFRTAVKDARDTAFLFAAMIAGMGCGTSFYMPVIAMTVFVSLLLLLLYTLDYGIKQKLESIVRITYEAKDETAKKIEGEMNRSFRGFRQINRILDFGDDHETIVYVVRPARSTNVTEFESRMRNIEGVVKHSLFETDQHAPF